MDSQDAVKSQKYEKIGNLKIKTSSKHMTNSDLNKGIFLLLVNEKSFLKYTDLFE